MGPCVIVARHYACRERRRRVRAMAGFGVPATRPTVLPGLDGVTRCSWATETGLDLTEYHDSEWGVPTCDEAVLFEALALTYFENGLSWANGLPEAGWPPSCVSPFRTRSGGGVDGE